MLFVLRPHRPESADTDFVVEHHGIVLLHYAVRSPDLLRLGHSHGHTKQYNIIRLATSPIKRNAQRCSRIIAKRNAIWFWGRDSWENHAHQLSSLTSAYCSPREGDFEANICI